MDAAALLNESRKITPFRERLPSESYGSSAPLATYRWVFLPANAADFASAASNRFSHSVESPKLLST